MCLEGDALRGLSDADRLPASTGLNDGVRLPASAGLRGGVRLPAIAAVETDFSVDFGAVSFLALNLKITMSGRELTLGFG